MLDVSDYPHLAALVLEPRENCHAILDMSGQEVAFFDDRPSFLPSGEPCGSITSRGRGPSELLYLRLLFRSAPALRRSLDRVVTLLENSRDQLPPDLASEVVVARSVLLACLDSSAPEHACFPESSYLEVK